ncbi:MAG TPA: DUF3662 and FHA domain-containing protein [Microbacteriaceae bacterium]|nr:DUF3662 and FHA domain-containing protein [Microbacteriaceae bacterium]HQX35049.1 DUF3662 and FHA domain-containing protein [Microbacteriaceae bacterium]HQZ47136.1 DUF3662 and FHA domain-containing protein [Microbacteriaceae bacterium]HRA08289.1 DUF3662 and FHA domain-containing protein [Microbacteriaceae bacterium]
MGLLDSFEKGLERAVNGAFAKTFRSSIQPVEIASALRRELDTRAAVVSRDRILAPNQLEVQLSANDLQSMQALGTTLYDELYALVQQHAKRQGYSFAGPLSISLVADPALSDGTLHVASTTEKNQVAWVPVLDIDGRRHTITKARTVIGRGSDADVTIADPGTSRKHVEVLWDGERAMVRDLGSTNGSLLDGQRITEAGLSPEQTIVIGSTSIVFRVIPQTTKPRGAAQSPPATAVFNQQVWDEKL